MPQFVVKFNVSRTFIEIITVEASNEDEAVELAEGEITNFPDANLTGKVHEAEWEIQDVEIIDNEDIE